VFELGENIVSINNRQQAIICFQKLWFLLTFIQALVSLSRFGRQLTANLAQKAVYFKVRKSSLKVIFEKALAGLCFNITRPKTTH